MAQPEPRLRAILPRATAEVLAAENALLIALSEGVAVDVRDDEQGRPSQALLKHARAGLAGRLAAHQLPFNVTPEGLRTKLVPLGFKPDRAREIVDNFVASTQVKDERELPSESQIAEAIANVVLANVIGGAGGGVVVPAGEPAPVPQPAAAAQAPPQPSPVRAFKVSGPPPFKPSREGLTPLEEAGERIAHEWAVKAYVEANPTTAAEGAPNIWEQQAAKPVQTLPTDVARDAAESRVRVEQEMEAARALQQPPSPVGETLEEAERLLDQQAALAALEAEAPA